MKYLNVYTADEEHSHRFYQVPKEFFVEEEYRKLNSDAKLLYSVLLDRKELSKKNNWVDEYNQVYLIYTREKLADLLSVSVRSIQRAFNILKELDLIKEERQGLNKPNKIYICRTRSNSHQGHDNLAHQDKTIRHTSDTELSDTDNNKKGSEQDSPLSFASFIEKYKPSEQSIEVIYFYLEYYNQVMKKVHPRLKPNQWQRVVDKVFFFGDDFEPDEQGLKYMVQKHFNTEYNDCDYNILHFATEGILTNRYYEEVH